MKLRLILLMFLLLIPFTIALDACTDQNEIDVADIPCQGVTNVITCSGNISILNLNTSVQTNLTTNSIGGNQYNFTFNFTQDSYEVKDCANNTATIIVGDFPRDDLWKFAIMIGYLGMAFLFVTMGRIVFEDTSWVVKSFLYIAGTLTILLGLSSSALLTLVTNINSLVDVSVIIASISIWIFITYMFIIYMVMIFKAVKQSKDTSESEL